MKYMFASIIAMLVIFGISYLLSRFALRKKKIEYKKIKTVILTVLMGLIIFILVGVVYLGNYYHGDDIALEALKGSDTVNVSEIDNGFYFDGPGEEKAIVFYPGAKVEYKAYARLMIKFAEMGYDCFLLKMPLNFALLGENIADNVVNEYDYDEWIMAGHSMGGIVAADYAQKHLDKIDGIVLLASYSTTKLDDSLKLCSIYGSEDKCLEQNVYIEDKLNLPKDMKEYVIEGGNHSQFGNYGNQKGDGASKITFEEQQKLTVDVVTEFFG